MSNAGSRILQGAREALAYAKSEAETAEYGLHNSAEVDARAIRSETRIVSRKKSRLR